MVFLAEYVRPGQSFEDKAAHSPPDCVWLPAAEFRSAFQSLHFYGLQNLLFHTFREVLQLDSNISGIKQTDEQKERKGWGTGGKRERQPGRNVLMIFWCLKGISGFSKAFHKN